MVSQPATPQESPTAPPPGDFAIITAEEDRERSAITPARARTNHALARGGNAQLVVFDDGSRAFVISHAAPGNPAKLEKELADIITEATKTPKPCPITR